MTNKLCSIYQKGELNYPISYKLFESHLIILINQKNWSNHSNYTIILKVYKRISPCICNLKAQSKPKSLSDLSISSE